MAGQAKLTIRDRQWTVSLAVTPYELSKGLGGLLQIAPQTGMLFQLGLPQTVQVTTVPMLFPLDVAFLSETLVITEIYRDIQPGYLVTSMLPAAYFLEVNAAELEGIDSGDRASVELLPPAGAMAGPDWVSAVISLMAFVVIGILVVGLVKDLMKGELGERQERPTLLPQTRPKGKFIIERDRIGSVVITRPGEPGRSVYLQFEADRELIYDILRKSEREDLDRGWTVAVKDSEPRASTLQELWEIHAERLMPQTIKGERLGGLESLPRTSNPLPFEPEEYLEWTAKFEAGYGQFRPGVSPEQVEKEIAAIPEAIRRTYIAEKYIGREKLFPRATELLPAVRKGLQVMPRLPEETRGDYLFVEYVRDLVRFGEKISDEEARRLWESWKKIPRSTLPESYQTRVAKPARPAIVPTAPRRARKKGELEYFADSSEFFSQTIDAIGYRDRIDSTFQEAIKRAKGLK